MPFCDPLTKFYGRSSLLSSSVILISRECWFPQWMQRLRGGFVLITFSYKQLLYANYQLKPKWHSCQPISGLRFLKILFGSHVLGSLRGMCRELLERHRVPFKSPKPYSWDRQSYPGLCWQLLKTIISKDSWPEELHFQICLEAAWYLPRHPGRFLQTDPRPSLLPRHVVTQKPELHLPALVPWARVSLYNFNGHVRVVEPVPRLIVEYRMRPARGLVTNMQHRQWWSGVSPRYLSGGSERYPAATKRPWTVQTEAQRPVCLISFALVLDVESKLFGLMIRGGHGHLLMRSSSIYTDVVPG